MSLKQIFCQDKAIRILQRAFAADKVPHAYIFAGCEGVGKYKIAREWAKLLLCLNPPKDNDSADSCGVCESCMFFEAGSHPDYNPVYKELIQFTKDGKDKKTPLDLPIDVIREFLIAKVSTRPTLSQRKLFVVSEAERLNRPSQNCLLKVLEEPPDYCCIILLCTRLERLLRTTRSRCQVVRFGPVAEDRIIEKLVGMGTQQQQAQYWARLAQGSLGQACQWAQIELAGLNLYEIKNQLIISLSTYKYAHALRAAQWLCDQTKKITALWAELDKTTSKRDINRRAQKTLVQIIISALYDAMKLRLPETGKIINFDQKEQIASLAKRFTLEQAAEKLADCYKTLRWIESAVNEKLIFEQLLLNLAIFDTMNVRQS